MATRKDIAEHLGVSVSVVSRALNNSGYVQAEKKEQILRTAMEMGYSREPAALRNLAGKTGKIMVYTSNPRNPFYIELNQGIYTELNSSGYNMLIGRSDHEDYARLFAGDGCIFNSEYIAYDYLHGAGKKDFRPMVAASFGCSLRLPSHVTIVECDLWAGAAKAIDYLRQKGHSRIAMISPYPREKKEARTLSWVSSMLPVLGDKLPEYYLEVSDTTRAQSPEGSLVGGNTGVAELTKEDFFENGCLAAKRFVQFGCDATAVLCYNEEMGLGFCKTMHQLKIRIPEDISVMAYDGTYLRRYFDKPLTALNMKPYLMGKCCAETLLKMLQGNKVRNHRVIPSEVLEGGTVADCREHNMHVY